MRPENRASLLREMDSLLEAAKANPQIDLSYEALSRAANVSRATAYRAPELKALWREKVANLLQLSGVPTKSLTAAQKAARTDATVKALQETIAIMANHIQALSLTVIRLEAEARR